MHYNLELPIVIETYTSDYVVAGIISQYDKSGILWPIVFYSKKYNLTKCNYEIYNKKLMTITRAFEH